jgi:phage tail-like protein
MTYPNLVLSWGFVKDQALLQWFGQTGSQPQLQEITITLTDAKSGSNSRTFTFTDAFPVRWSGPQLLSDQQDPETWGETLEIAHSGLKLPGVT